jgi:HSP20 family protein
MSYLRDLNHKPSFWDWVTDMGGAPPDQAWPQAGNKNNNNNNTTTATDANAGEGPSGTHADEKKHLLEQDTEMIPPPEYDGEDPPTPPEEYPEDPFAPGHDGNEKLPDRSVYPPGEGEEPGDDAPPRDGPGRRGGRGCHRGGSGERGGPWHHHGGPPHHPHGSHPWWGGGRGGRGGWGRRGRGGFGGPPGAMPFGAHFPPGVPPFGPFGFGGLGGGLGGGFGGDLGEGPRGGRGWMEMAKKFAERFGVDPNQLKNGNLEEGVDFEPAIDVYSTPTSYVVHLALPGAKKEDVAVTWDENQAALNVSGVVTRGVDEEMANQLALGERPIGFFKRVVRLGDREHPAHVDADSIAAKMEEGVLKITVGKVEEFVEVKKVQVD